VSEPEEFTGELQKVLKSSPQPYLVPFLKVYSALLSQALYISCIEAILIQFWAQVFTSALSSAFPQGILCSALTSSVQPYLVPFLKVCSALLSQALYISCIEAILIQFWLPFH